MNRRLTGALLAPLLLLACDGETTPDCTPETDRAFCTRNGFDCDLATEFDNCDTSRTVNCGMCSAPLVCGGGGASNVCGDATPSDAGRGMDAGSGGDAGGEIDAGADAGVDAGTCLAGNGWPMDSLPGGFAGTGYAVGDTFVPFSGAVDQNGATDVSLGQFYGAMLLVVAHAVWNPPSRTMDMTGQSRADMINATATDYTFVQVSVLTDDATPGGGAMGGYARGTDARDWALDYGLRFPVLADQAAYDFSIDASVTSLPTLYIIDPMFEVREVIVGWPGNGPVISSVQNAFAAFRAENPTWVSTYCAQ